MDFLGMLARIAKSAGTIDERRVALDENIDGGVVSTVAVTDSTLPYETAIAHPLYRSGQWIVVELYPDKESATIGHKKWVQVLLSRPAHLTDANQSEVGDFIEAVGGETTRMTFERDTSVSKE